VKKKQFTLEDCFPVSRADRLNSKPIRISFSRDIWGFSTSGSHTQRCCGGARWETRGGDGCGNQMAANPANHQDQRAINKFLPAPSNLHPIEVDGLRKDTTLVDNRLRQASTRAPESIRVHIPLPNIPNLLHNLLSNKIGLHQQDNRRSRSCGEGMMTHPSLMRGTNL